MRGRPDHGFALLLALAVLLLVAAAVLLAFGTALSGKNAVERERRLIELRAGSDAALAETMAALAEDGDFSGLPQRIFGGAAIASTVARRPDGALDVAATATRGGWRISLNAIVRIGAEGKPRIVAWERSPVRPTGRATVSVVR